MSLICEILLAVNLVTDNVGSVLSANVSDGGELSSAESCSSWVAWIIQEKVVSLSLEFGEESLKLNKIDVEFTILISWDPVVLVVSQFSLRSIRYPSWVWGDEISVKYCLENKKVFN